MAEVVAGGGREDRQTTSGGGLRRGVGPREIAPDGVVAIVPMIGAGPGRPGGSTEARPAETHDDGGEERGREPGHDDLGPPGEGHCRGDEHHRVERRRRQHEGQGGGRRRSPCHEPAGHRDRTAFAAGDEHAGQAGHRHRHRWATGEHPGQGAGRNEGGDGPADEDAEHQEGEGLHGQRDEHRGPGLGGRTGEGPHQQRPQQQGRHASEGQELRCRPGSAGARVEGRFFDQGRTRSIHCSRP